MFKGEESVSLPAGVTDDQARAKIEDILGELGRVRIDKRGEISIEPKDKFGSFLTDVAMSGQLRKRCGGLEVSVAYDCKPSVVNWIIAVVGTLTLCLGFLVLLVPMTAKGPVSKAVRGALGELEEALGGTA